MKLAASNIGWTADRDEQVLRHMAEHGFSGLEIAPTRVFPDAPYDQRERAARYASNLKDRYGLRVCSMQSIWYGQTRRIAESGESRAFLLDYTRKAIRFADALHCGSLVFGCPRNRAYTRAEDIPILEDFLWQCAEAAMPYGVVIALEANPPMYHTNFVTTTGQAVALVKRLNHPALRLNLDLGTVLANGETTDWIAEDGSLIHHVHISEPNLAPIQKRPAHQALRDQLERIGYRGFLSIEMRADASVLDTIDYVGEAFHNAPPQNA